MTFRHAPAWRVKRAMKRIMKVVRFPLVAKDFGYGEPASLSRPAKELVSRRYGFIIRFLNAAVGSCSKGSSPTKKKFMPQASRAERCH
jgi:hypothetical protein